MHLTRLAAASRGHCAASKQQAPKQTREGVSVTLLVFALLTSAAVLFGLS
jgi:hypothetical protein